MKSLTYVEIDVDFCSRVYGVAPCTASIPTTGTAKCFNSLGTCQDRTNFGKVVNTLRFAMDTSYLPVDIDAFPSLVGVSVTPAVISLGVDLGQRASVTVTFKDHRHNDVGFDPYLATRGYDAFKQGSFWGKFRARNPYLRGRELRVIQGYLGQTLEEMVTRTFIIESSSGPTQEGLYTVTAKDALKMADGDRAQAPRLSNGFTSATITNAQTSLVVSPTNAGSEYTESGHVAIGGKEIVKFERDNGVGAGVVLLLSFAGADASTAILDTSPVSRSIVPLGNAQIDTSQSKFGGSSLLLDGTGDYLSLSSGDSGADFAFGTGDFTIEMQVRLNALGAVQTLYDDRPLGLQGFYPTLYISGTNFLTYMTNSVVRITGATALTVGVWNHVALCRKDGITRLFLNGTLQGAAYADANNYIHSNGSSRPFIGGASSTIGTSINGWLDEVRVSLRGRWDATFTPPTAAYSTATGDTFKITRAQFNTLAVAHNQESRVQQCLQYSGVDPALIIKDLLVNYAEVPSTYIPEASWLAETQAYLQRIYTTLIADPVSVSALVAELIEQAALAIWWDDVQGKLQLQVLRPIPTTAKTFSGENVIEGSTTIQEQPNKRLSEVWTFYARINPLVSLTNQDNYRSVAATVDLQASTDYGTAAIKKIFSRWIPEFGRSIATRLNDLVLGRYRDPPRRVTFELFREEGVSLGSGYQFRAWCLQDATGAEASIPIQVVRHAPESDRSIIEAEEALFTRYDVSDSNNRVITIDTSTNDFNLRAVHDTLYPVITNPAGLTVTCIIQEGVTVGSSNASTVAFDVGSWVAGLDLTVRVLGRIQGAGGDAGQSGSNGTINGEKGGTAIYSRYAFKLDSSAGEVWGGGGGGGSEGPYFNGSYLQGGGGAGTVGGTGWFGGMGTAEAGGASRFNGGDVSGAGGGPGLAGSASVGSDDSGTGGAAGNAIDGVSYVTVLGVAGDVRGSQVN